MLPRTPREPRGTRVYHREPSRRALICRAPPSPPAACPAPPPLTLVIGPREPPSRLPRHPGCRLRQRHQQHWRTERGPCIEEVQGLHAAAGLTAPLGSLLPPGSVGGTAELAGALQYVEQQYRLRLGGRTATPADLQLLLLLQERGGEGEASVSTQSTTPRGQRPAAFHFLIGERSPFFKAA